MAPMTPPDRADETVRMRAAPRELTGRCVCGATGYIVPDAFEYAMNCHCSRCRRATGSAFKAMAGVLRDRLTPIGEDVITIHGDEQLHDARCRHCGSLLYSVVRDGAYVHVAMGTLVDEPSIRPSMHIYTAFKAGWHEIADELPQHLALPERNDP